MKTTFAHIRLLAGLTLFCASCATNVASPQKFSGATPLEWSTRLADSQMALLGDRLDWKAGGTAKWDYTAGLFTLSLLKLNEQVRDPLYVKFSEFAIGSFISRDGKIQGYKPEEYQLDALDSGKTVLALWQITHDEHYKNAAMLLRKQLDTQPRTSDGGFWHKQRYPHQMWLDGLYMAEPFYAEYAELFDETNDFDDVAKQISLIDGHTFDPATGLFYHGWDETKSQPWANPATGCSSNFWGRAIGWYAMAMVDTLDYFPTNHPARAEIISTFQKLCTGVVKYQDAQSGVWYQVVDQRNRKGNYFEATASAMFVYALAKGVNRGYLSQDYVPAILDGYRGLIKNFIQYDGNLTWSLAQCCQVAGLGGGPSNGKPRDGSFGYYVSEPIVKNDLKGIGPFILAGIEVQQLLDEQTRVRDEIRRLIASKNQKMVAVKVINPSDFRRDDETVEINLTAVASNLHLDPAADKFAVIDGLSARILDSQVYASETNLAPDKLLFQVGLAPNETRTFYILDASALPAEPPPIAKTFARHVPERYDDFAWESDRIAHRIYGQALIKAEGTISSGPDVWVKSRRNLMVNEMYASGHYHMDNGDEMDDYRVGHSRGCGGLGIWDGTKLFVSSNYQNWKLITTGPIRSEFELTYDAWDAGGGRMVSETKRISIDAGSWFSKMQSTLASDDKSPLTVGVGLAERACPTNRVEFFARDQNEGWLAYWQPEDKPKGVIGDAIILAKGSVQEFTNDAPDLPEEKLRANVPQPTHEGYPPIRNQLAITKVEVGQPLTYYFGACWDRSGDFTNHVQWENYVKRFAERRDQPLQVTVGN
jgi:rhamnogalacturonyl hydrolase YesR